MMRDIPSSPGVRVTVNRQSSSSYLILIFVFVLIFITSSEEPGVVLLSPALFATAFVSSSISLQGGNKIGSLRSFQVKSLSMHTDGADVPEPLQAGRRNDGHNFKMTADDTISQKLAAASDELRTNENSGNLKTARSSSFSPAIQNFRQALSLPRIYRCASTDVLAELVLYNIINSKINYENYDKNAAIDCFKDWEIDSAEHVLLNRAGLVLDLRSPSEIDERRVEVWTSNAPGGKLTVIDLEGITRKDGPRNRRRHVRSRDDKRETSSRMGSRGRTVLRIDVLSPSKLFAYLSSKWLNSAQKALSSLYHAVDADKLHELRMDVLNQRGLPGLYEAIVQTSGVELCAALQAITEYLEVADERGEEDSAVVVHCVQGKDRTGLVIMLCQSIIGLSDEEIIHDYNLSDHMRKRDSGSAAADSMNRQRRRGKLDRTVFSGAPREAMLDTLTMIRSQYGSVSPGYLDSIGFNDEWRARFVSAVLDRQKPLDLRSKL